MAHFSDQIFLSQILRKSISVWKSPNQFLLVLFDELNILLHDIPDDLVDVVGVIVN